MLRKKILFLIVLTISIYFLTNCGKGLSSEIKDSVDKTLISLRKMDNASELKQPLSEYRKQLVETKAEVENTLAKIPETELKKEIRLALDAYIDGLRVREHYQKEQSIFNSPDPMAAYGLSIISLDKTKKDEADLAQVLAQKYGIEGRDDKNDVIIRLGEAEKTLRETGRIHIERASELLKQ